ncbi:MAG: Na-translocating system protein MpsC family protein [Solirubrobacteraceae bacterium]
MSSTQTDRPGEIAAAISNLVVKLVAEYTGRGPTKSRTYINEDLITIVLQDTLTKGEQSLVRDGKSELVLGMRLAFQQTMRPVFISGIERITGRTVRAFLSANHMDPDVAIENFLLESV